MAMNMEQWTEGLVIENRHWNDRLCSLKVEVELPKFKAGQFLRLALPKDGEMLARAYSLVNSPRDPHAEFYFNRVPGGPLSTKLYQLQVGDSVYISKVAAGFLTLSEVPSCKRLWMLATGTAIGPFLSILQTDEPWQRVDKVVLVHGVRSVDEQTYQAVKQQLLDQYPGKFISITSITREQVSGAIAQRIPDAIRSGALEQAAKLTIDLKQTHVMICGSPGMVEDSMTALKEKGLRKHRRRKPGHISVEIYK